MLQKMFTQSHSEFSGASPPREMDHPIKKTRPPLGRSTGRPAIRQDPVPLGDRAPIPLPIPGFTGALPR